MEIKYFPPGSFITVDDVTNASRKLVRVGADGTTYVEVDGPDASALPIWDALNPQEAGDVLAWGLSMVDQDPEHALAFTEVCRRLAASGEGVLTYTRAAYWAFESRVFDFDMALEHGRKQTIAVIKSRAALDALTTQGGDG